MFQKIIVTILVIVAMLSITASPTQAVGEESSAAIEQLDASAPVTLGVDGNRKKVSGSVTHMGYTSGLPNGAKYAATHHGDKQWTFQQGARLLVTHRNRSIVVIISDYCDGPNCKMLDLSSKGFSDLFGGTSQGVGKVDVQCGKAGLKPIRKCLVGEDK